MVLLECLKFFFKFVVLLYLVFGLFFEEEILIILSLDDYVWLLVRNLIREMGSDEV